MTRTWIGLMLLAFVSLFAVACGKRITPTQVPQATQAPSPATAAPRPTVTIARETLLTVSPTAPMAAQAETTLPPANPTATTAASIVITGLTEDGHHFWGAPDASVTMIEFSDFM